MGGIVDRRRRTSKTFPDRQTNQGTVDELRTKPVPPQWPNFAFGLSRGPFALVAASPPATELVTDEIQSWNTLGFRPRDRR